MDRKSGPRSEQVLEMGATGMDPPRVEWKFFFFKWAPKIVHEAGVLHDGKQKELFVMTPYREAAWVTQLLPKAQLALLPIKKPTFWTERKAHVTIRDPIMLLYFGPQSKVSEITHRFKAEFTAIKLYVIFSPTLYYRHLLSC